MAAADCGYDDDHKLYNLSIGRRGFELVCPVSEIYNHISADRLQLINFYLRFLIRTGNSFLERYISRAINRIHQRCFQNSPLSVRGYQKAAGITLLSVLLYQIIVYYNCKTRKQQNPKAIKHMLGS